MPNDNHRNEEIGRSGVRVMPMASKPLVCGVGIVSPAGVSPAGVVEAVLKGSVEFCRPPFESARFADRRVALVEGFDSREFIKPRRAARYMSRETQFAVGALSLCLNDLSVRSGFERHAAPGADPDFGDASSDDAMSGRSMAWVEGCPWADPYETALFAGTGSSGISLDDIMPMLNNSCDPLTGRFDISRFSSHGLGKLNPLTSFRILPNMPPSVAVIYGGVKGENLIFNPWEGSAVAALAEGMAALGEGRCRLALCGGSDCKTHSDAFITFEEYGFFETGNFVMSEGSAYLALLPGTTLLSNGFRPYCRIAGMASMTVRGDSMACEMGAEECTGLIEGALDSAGTSAREIDLVISSQDFGSGDIAEASALDELLPGVRTVHPARVLGNAVASAGYFSLSLGSAMLESVEPLVPGVGRVLVNSFGFGSEKHCVVLERS